MKKVNSNQKELVMLETLRNELQNHWKNRGFNQPTPIQEQLISEANQGNSVIAISPTGTGKTLAYLLPILNKIEANQTLQAIILAPSQELAIQIAEVAREWGKEVGIKTQSLIGGANISRQIDKLKEKPELVVATPGRFQELQQKSNKLKVHTVTTIVFDEADYLLKDEHKGAINRIKQSLMRDVQKIYTSATMPDEVLDQLTGEDADLTLLSVEDQASKYKVKHIYLTVNNRDKIKELKRLSQVPDMRAIVFFEQIHQIEEVAAKLIFEKVPLVVLHSEASKMEREYAIRAFTNHDVKFLLTTDVASRGIDIANVPYVIHYNRVDNLQTYLHRSGRTGRMDAEGTVISLVNQQELLDLNEILKVNQIQVSEKVLRNTELLDPSDDNRTDRDNRNSKQHNPRKTNQSKVNKQKSRRKAKK